MIFSIAFRFLPQRKWWRQCWTWMPSPPPSPPIFNNIIMTTTVNGAWDADASRASDRNATGAEGKCRRWRVIETHQRLDLQVLFFHFSDCTKFFFTDNSNTDTLNGTLNRLAVLNLSNIPVSHAHNYDLWPWFFFLVRVVQLPSQLSRLSVRSAPTSISTQVWPR